MIECNFRIGNDKYLKENKSYGVTTLLNKHIQIKGDTVTLDINGKKDVQNTNKVKNKKKYCFRVPGDFRVPGGHCYAT